MRKCEITYKCSASIASFPDNWYTWNGVVQTSRINDTKINFKVIEVILCSVDLDFTKYSRMIIAALHEVITVKGMMQKQAKSIQEKMMYA